MTDFATFSIDFLHEAVPSEHAQGATPVLLLARSAQQLFDFALQRRDPLFQCGITRHNENLAHSVPYFNFGGALSLHISRGVCKAKAMGNPKWKVCSVFDLPMPQA